MLYVAHGYLHAWAYHWIRTLLPEHRFGEAPITRENIEKYAFLHLLTEAVATVGLDYWYLGSTNLNTICPIGTSLQSLAVGYRESNTEEYCRFLPGLDAQRREFFGVVANFYCSGVWPGLDPSDLARSPQLSDWLSHELHYGVKQRRYTRQWLAYLSSDDIALTATEMDAPVRLEASWMAKLTQELGELLWAKVKQDEMCVATERIDPALAWKQDVRIDARFTNLRSLSSEQFSGYRPEPEAEWAYTRQLLSQFEFSSLSPQVVEALRKPAREGNGLLLRFLLRESEPMPGADGPRDLFFLY